MRQTSRRWQLTLLGILAGHLGSGCGPTVEMPDTPGPTGAAGAGGGSGGHGSASSVAATGSVGATSGGGSPGTCAKLGETRPCYDGDSSTANVGICKSGMQTCEDAGGILTWGMCIGQMTPLPELCDNIDNDCDGIVDNGISCGPGGSCAGGPSPCATIPISPKTKLVSGCSLPFPPAKSLPCPVPNPGPQYYVSATTGNDANDGKTPATAWATLCYATSAAPDGSTLQVAEGDYASASVYVGKELTVKGGYDAIFSSWDPDLHPSNFYGKLTLDHNAAVWGGFRMLSSSIQADNWSYMHHRIAAGTLVRNYIEIVAESGADPDVLNLYGIVASACEGGTSVLRCNDIYVRSSAPQAFVVDAIEYGNEASHEGNSVVDSNRICQDGGGPATTTIAGYGSCGGTIASLLITNNVIEKAGTSGGRSIEFYGCSEADMDITLTNNTILSSGDGVAGYDGNGSSVLHWKLTNNIIFSTGKMWNAVNVGTGKVKIDSSIGNLSFGFASNGIFPPPLLSKGDDTTGKAEPTIVFVNPAAGDFRLLPGGMGAGTGINVYGNPAYGAVTTDIVQAPRPATGPWDRGSYGR